jgi:hypothetical protein
MKFTSGGEESPYLSCAQFKAEHLAAYGVSVSPLRCLHLGFFEITPLAP